MKAAAAASAAIQRTWFHRPQLRGTLSRRVALSMLPGFTAASLLLSGTFFSKVTANGPLR